MDSSFITPPPAEVSSESDRFIEDIFCPSSTGGLETLLVSRPSFSQGPSRATSPAVSCALQLTADPERSQVTAFSERLSTLAIHVGIAGLSRPDFSIQDFQYATVTSFQTILPNTQNAALQPLLEAIFYSYTSASEPLPAVFGAIGQALHAASISSSPRPSHLDLSHASMTPALLSSSTSDVATKLDNDVARLLAFQAKLPILLASDSDSIRTFLQSWQNYKTTGILSLLDCISADARTALELVYADQLYAGRLDPSDEGLERFLRCVIPTPT